MSFLRTQESSGINSSRYIQCIFWIPASPDLSGSRFGGTTGMTREGAWLILLGVLNIMLCLEIGIQEIIFCLILLHHLCHLRIEEMLSDKVLGMVFLLISN